MMHAQSHLAEAPGTAARICPSTLRTALGRFATGVAIMTTMTAGRRAVGLTANSFSSVSLDPALILWSLAKKSPNRSAFEDAGYFAVNVLTTQQAGISTRFAQPLADKFHGVEWRPGLQGVPVISGCIAHFECRLKHRVDGGDHTIFIGEVERFASHCGEPLLFLGSRYHRATPLTTSQNASLGLQDEIKRGSHITEPKAPPNCGGEAPA